MSHTETGLDVNSGGGSADDPSAPPIREAGSKLFLGDSHDKSKRSIFHQLKRYKKRFGVSAGADLQFARRSTGTSMELEEGASLNMSDRSSLETDNGYFVRLSEAAEKLSTQLNGFLRRVPSIEACTTPATAQFNCPPALSTFMPNIAPAPEADFFSSSADSVLPERFARDWYEKIKNSRLEQLQKREEELQLQLEEVAAAAAAVVPVPAHPDDNCLGRLRRNRRSSSCHSLQTRSLGRRFAHPKLGSRKPRLRRAVTFIVDDDTLKRLLHSSHSETSAIKEETSGTSGNSIGSDRNNTGEEVTSEPNSLKTSQIGVGMASHRLSMVHENNGLDLFITLDNQDNKQIQADDESLSPIILMHERPWEEPLYSIDQSNYRSVVNTNQNLADNFNLGSATNEWAPFNLDEAWLSANQEPVFTQNEIQNSTNEVFKEWDQILTNYRTVPTWNEYLTNDEAALSFNRTSENSTSERPPAMGDKHRRRLHGARGARAPPPPNLRAQGPVIRLSPPIFSHKNINFYKLFQQVNASATRFTQCHMRFSKFTKLNKFSQLIFN